MIYNKPKNPNELTRRDFKIGPGEYGLWRCGVWYRIIKGGPKFWQIRDEFDDLVDSARTITECLEIIESFNGPK